MENDNAVDEDWALLVSFFPAKWKQLARSSEALKGLRQDKSAEGYLRVLLLHFGCGFSMRETVLRAKEAQLAQLSDVALLKRLRKSKEWLYQLCCTLFAERGIHPQNASDQALRLVDSTVVKEPGKTGSLWRIHYSFQWPTMVCDYFKITPIEGIGNGETLQHFPIKTREFLLADRGYCQASGIHFVAEKDAYLTVRLNCHRSVQNRPVVIESKPATFMVSKGFDLSWQGASLSAGSFFAFNRRERGTSEQRLNAKYSYSCLRGAFSRSRSKRNKWREARREAPFMPDLDLNWRMRSALGEQAV